MKDLFDSDICEGDTVAFNPPVYKGLVTGVIVGFTSQMVKVSYEPTGKQRYETTNVRPNDVVVKPLNN